MPSLPIRRPAHPALKGLLLALLSSAPGIAQAGTFTVSTPGAGSWTVPEGVTRIAIVAVGGGGGGGWGGRGGHGARIELQEVMVTPGQSVTYFVGGGGGVINGDAGSGGGGSTNVQFSAGTVPDVVAGGGGGGAYRNGGDGCASGLSGGFGGAGETYHDALGGQGGGAGVGGMSGENNNRAGDGFGGAGGAGFDASNGGSGAGLGRGSAGAYWSVGTGGHPGGGGGYGGGGAGAGVYMTGGAGAGGSLWPGMTSATPNAPTCVPGGNGGPGGQAGGHGSLTMSWVEAPSGPVQPRPLNDTGVTWSGQAPSGNATVCDSAHPAGQDCFHGRDAAARVGAGVLEKVGHSAPDLDPAHGHVNGFDFTKISNSGNPLPASATLGSGPDDWACTRDNVTGLIWEVKVNDATHLRHMNHTYTWYDTDPVTNGGEAGSIGGDTCNGTLAAAPYDNRCNTQHYVEAINALTGAGRLCGATDWRVPTIKELENLADFGRANPSIDPHYFPNTPVVASASNFWSSTPMAGQSHRAWFMRFSGSMMGATYIERVNGYYLRLVRTAL